MKRYCLAAVITASLGVSYSAQAYNCAGVASVGQQYSVCWQ